MEMWLSVFEITLAVIIMFQALIIYAIVCGILAIEKEIKIAREYQKVQHNNLIGYVELLIKEVKNVKS